MIDRPEMCQHAEAMNRLQQMSSPSSLRSTLWKQKTGMLQQLSSALEWLKKTKYFRIYRKPVIM